MLSAADICDSQSFPSNPELMDDESEIPAWLPFLSVLENSICTVPGFRLKYGISEPSRIKFEGYVILSDFKEDIIKFEKLTNKKLSW